MPVSRGWINQQLKQRPDLWRALSDIANAHDALEKALGAGIGTGSAASAPGAPASWTITASSGQYVHQIAPPAGAAPLQYQLQSALTAGFVNATEYKTYTLGLGASTAAVFDPGQSKFWRLRWRSAGSAWSNWLAYADAQGTHAVASGGLPAYVGFFFSGTLPIGTVMEWTPSVGVTLQRLSVYLQSPGIGGAAGMAISCLQGAAGCEFSGLCPAGAAYGTSNSPSPVGGGSATMAAGTAVTIAVASDDHTTRGANASFVLEATG